MWRKIIHHWVKQSLTWTELLPLCTKIDPPHLTDLHYFYYFTRNAARFSLCCRLTHLPSVGLSLVNWFMAYTLNPSEVGSLSVEVPVSWPLPFFRLFDPGRWSSPAVLIWFLEQTLSATQRCSRRSWRTSSICVSLFACYSIVQGSLSSQPIKGLLVKKAPSRNLLFKVFLSLNFAVPSVSGSLT